MNAIKFLTIAVAAFLSLLLPVDTAQAIWQHVGTANFTAGAVGDTYVDLVIGDAPYVAYKR